MALSLVTIFQTYSYLNKMRITFFSKNSKSLLFFLLNQELNFLKFNFELIFQSKIQKYSNFKVINSSVEEN